MPRIVILSDTHENQDYVTVSDGDILIHCGDWTNRGYDESIEEFLTWFSSLPHTHKICIPGNHELGLDKGPSRQSKLDIINSFTNKHSNLHYLENSEITIDGFKIYGSPNQPWFHDWAWNVHRGPAIAQIWSQIPDDTNILITHGPPHGILDLVDKAFGRDPHQGCEDLLERIDQLKELKLHAFGHLHKEGGQSRKINNITFVNGAICDDNHMPSHSPVIVDL